MRRTGRILTLVGALLALAALFIDTGPLRQGPTFFSAAVGVILLYAGMLLSRRTG